MYDFNRAHSFFTLFTFVYNLTVHGLSLQPPCISWWCTPIANQSYLYATWVLIIDDSVQAFAFLCLISRYHTTNKSSAAVYCSSHFEAAMRWVLICQIIEKQYTTEHIEKKNREEKVSSLGEGLDFNLADSIPLSPNLLSRQRSVQFTHAPFYL